MRDSVPSVRYSPVCNVLRQWKTLLIPTYRVYGLYDKNLSHARMLTTGSLSANEEEHDARSPDRGETAITENRGRRHIVLLVNATALGLAYPAACGIGAIGN